jgi:nucleoside-diphosphate-sugar epimerase
MLQNNLIITGASSKSGFYFLKILESFKFKKRIVIILRDKSQKDLFKKLKLNICFIFLDLKNIHKHLRTEMFHDYVFLHIAGIFYSKLILKFCIKNKVRWLICVHTSGKFSLFKKEANYYNNIDRCIKLFRKDLNITILYPTMIFGTVNDGNISRLIRFINKSIVFPIIGDGRNSIQPIYYQDLSMAYYKIILNYRKTNNKEYLLSGYQPLEFRKVLLVINNILNKKTLFINIPITVSIFMVFIFNFFSKKKIDINFIKRFQEDRVFKNNKAVKDFYFTNLNFSDAIKKQIKEMTNLKIIN